MTAFRFRANDEETRIAALNLALEEARSFPPALYPMDRVVARAREFYDFLSEQKIAEGKFVRGDFPEAAQ